MDKILLIDAMNQIHRANVQFGPKIPHAHCDIENSHHTDKHPAHRDIHCQCGAAWNEEEVFCYGDKYNIIYSFFRSLRVNIENFQPVKAFFALEGHPQFRYDLFPEYKADRLIKRSSKQDTYDRVIDQANQITNLLQYLPITVVRAAKYECDDTIGTLCENMKDEDLTVISNDADYTQLLQRGYKNIRVFNPIKKEDRIAPEYHFTLYRTLVGDKSDGIKRLVSDKKAKEMCAEPQLLKNFLENEESRANFNINRQLVEFKSVPTEEIEMKDGETNFPALKEEFERMKFNSITNEDNWKKFVSTFDCLKY
jgi:5'-3' exonuclease